MRRSPWGVCQRCDEKRRLTELRREWSGWLVCPPCFDPKPPELKPPKYGPEGMPWPNSSPQLEPVFREDYPIPEGDDL